MTKQDNPQKRVTMKKCIPTIGILCRPLLNVAELGLLALVYFLCATHAASAATGTVGVSFSGKGNGEGTLSVALNHVTNTCANPKGGGNNCYPYCTATGSVDLNVGATYTLSVTSECGCTNNVPLWANGSVTLSDSCYVFQCNGVSVFPPDSLTFSTTGGASFPSFSIQPRNTNEVQFSRNPLPPDEESISIASLAGLGAPPPLTWSIIGPTNANGSINALGCAINSTNGIITAGTNEGTLTLHCTDGNGCTYTGDLELAWCQGCTTGCDSDANGQSGTQSLGSTDVANQSVSLRMSLGAASPYKHAGYLTVKESAPSTNLYWPGTLQYYYKRDGVTKVLDSQGILRQVASAAGLADVQRSTNLYWVDFYPASQVGVWNSTSNLFPVSGYPLVTVRVENPDASGASSNAVRVTAIREDVTVTNDFVWTNGGWQLTSGNGLRRDWVVSGTTNGIRTVRREIRGASSTPASVSQQRYLAFPWGERLIEDVLGTGANARTNSYSYYDNGLLHQATHPTGAWEIYEYDDLGRPAQVYSAWLNQTPTTDPSSCRFVQYYYSSSEEFWVNAFASNVADDPAWDRSTPRMILESVQTWPVRRLYNAITFGHKATYECFDPTWDGELDDSNSSKTETTFITSGDQKDKPQLIFRDDTSLTGTREFYDYVCGENNYVTNWVWRGTAASNEFNSYIGDGTLTAEVCGPLGELHQRSTWRVVGGVAQYLLDNEVRSNFDQYGRATFRQYLDGTSSSVQYYACCGLAVSTNREGSATTNRYDLMQRRVGSTFNGITTSNILDAAGRTVATLRIGTNSTVIQTRGNGYSDNGELVVSTNALGKITSYYHFFDADGYWVEATVNPDGGTITNRYFRDGQLYQVLGSAAVPTTHSYNVGSATVQHGSKQLLRLARFQACMDILAFYNVPDRLCIVHFDMSAIAGHRGRWQCCFRLHSN